MYGALPGSGSFPQVVAVPFTETVRPSALEQPQPLMVPATVKQLAPVVSKFPLWPPLTALQVPPPLELPLEELEPLLDEELELPPDDDEDELPLDEPPEEELPDELELEPELEEEPPLDDDDEDDEQQALLTVIPLTFGLSGPPPLVKAMTTCPSAFEVAAKLRATALAAPPAAA